MASLLRSWLRRLPFRLGLATYSARSAALIWSKGVGEFCDFAGPRWYRLSATESTQPEAFFAEHYKGAHGLVWLRLGTISRDGLRCDIDAFARAALSTINRPFILITTDGDATVPSDIRAETVEAVCAHPHLVGWYTQNCGGGSRVIRPFPIGLNLHTQLAWTTPRRLVAFLDRLGRNAPPARMRRLRVFCDLNLSPTDARREAIDALRDCEHVDFAASRVSQTAIWQRYASYPLILSAHGNGLDCHRTWELLLLGCIVVVKTSSLDPLYAGLPVVIIDDWQQVRDPIRLARWVEEFSPLSDPDYIRQRLRSESWLRPLRDRLVDLRAPSWPDARASFRR